ncbi:MAG TPA: 3'-5' exoribonuclease YhaM family protein [Candidatus Brocadiia bacterium]|nr:HD domain-containing protein [Candidatus Brocadiales bacterium]
MPRKFVSELKSGDVIDQVFLVQKKELRTARNGSSYIQAQFSDRTGSITGRMWDTTEALFQSFNENDFVKIRGQLGTYQNTLQLTFSGISKVDEGAVSLEDFLPRTQKDVGKMLQEFQEIVASIKNAHLAALLTMFMNDADFCKALCSTPAAVDYHHAFIGGLLEHTLSLANAGMKIVDNYPVLNRDLLLTGIILHDIGKTRELAYRRSFQYTDDGQLVGHLVIGAMMVEEKAKQITNFPRELLNVLQHMILSHHGEYQFGSPRLPQTAEAVALHYLDNLDAKMYAFEKAVKDSKDPSSNWTEFVKMFDRRLFKGLKE